VGVFSPELIPVIAGVLGALGTKRALVIHSKDGLDEISTTGTTLMCEYRNGVTTGFEMTPEMCGFKRVSADQLQGGTVRENVRTMLDILKGAPGIKRDIVVLNAAGALYAADQAASISEGVAAASRAIDSGDAIKKFEALKEFTSNG
jgi:anthranilate phosphoribosyltransferase